MSMLLTVKLQMREREGERERGTLEKSK